MFELIRSTGEPLFDPEMGPGEGADLTKPGWAVAVLFATAEIAALLWVIKWAIQRFI